MARLIEANLPLYIQSLSVPSEWGLGRSRSNRWLDSRKKVSLSSLLTLGHETEGDSITVRKVPGVAVEFDPWEKRTEFFGLKRGDATALLAFLRSVGLFERATGEDDPARNAVGKTSSGLKYEVRYLSDLSQNYIWSIRDLLLRTLKLRRDAGKQVDFQVRIIRSRGRPQAIFTTTTFLDAVLLTLSIDRVEGAKVRKCARRDCAAVFSYTSGHKRKYCRWYCGHIESVRKQRRKYKQASTKASLREGVKQWLSTSAVESTGTSSPSTARRFGNPLGRQTSTRRDKWSPPIALR